MRPPLVSATTTPIYERPDTSAPTTTVVPPTTVPARPAGGPEPAFVSEDEEVEVLIQGVDENELPSAINPNGRLILTTGNFVRVQGRGFTNAGFAEVWLYSTPQLLGRVPKDGSGNFVGRVRVPMGLEAGEHTIELRAKTRRGRSILMSVPAIVIGAATTSEGSPSTDIVTEPDIDAVIVTSTIASEPKLIEIEPGATEVAVPVDVIVEVVVRALPPDISPSETEVEVRTNVTDWRGVDLKSVEPVVLPIDDATDGVDVQATSTDGRVFGGSIPIAVSNSDDQVALLGILAVLMIGIFGIWIIAWKRRRDDEDRD